MYFCHALSQQCSPKLNVTDCNYSQEWKSQILYLLSMDCTTTGQWANQIQVFVMSGVYIVYTPVVACMDYIVFQETELHCGCHGILYNRFAVVQERDVHWANQQSEIIQELGKVNA